MIRGVFALLLAFSCHAATTITLQPSASTPNSGDAYTTAFNAGANSGNSGALVVSGVGTVKGAFQSVLRYDLAGVKSAFDSAYGAGNWTLDMVQLQLSAATPNNATFNANAAGLVLIEWLADDSWLESTITWNGMSGVVAGGTESIALLNYNGANSGTLLQALATSAGFLADFNSGGTASLRLSAADALMSMVVNARNFGTAANRPALVFTASPEPARGLFCAAGLLAVMLRRKRRSKALQHDLSA